MSLPSVLIVDDDDLIRKILADLLRDAGYSVLTAPDGKPALERLRTHPEGLVVVLDLMMPGMDGLALLQAIAAEAPLKRQHAYILVSAMAKMLPPKVVELLKHLNVMSLPKPFDLDEVLAVVQQAASRLQGPASASALVGTEEPGNNFHAENPDQGFSLLEEHVQV